MPHVRLPEDAGPGSYRHRDGLSVEGGDTVEVDDDRASYLVDEWGFERVAEEGDAETCDAVKSDGEVCGRELPCPYHSDEDGGEEE